MLSKCANPECNEKFLYLDQGKVFRLWPNPRLHASAEQHERLLSERFWLCAECARTMTIVWGGAHIKVISILKKIERVSALPREQSVEALVPAFFTGKAIAVSAGGKDK